MEKKLSLKKIAQITEVLQEILQQNVDNFDNYYFSEMQWSRQLSIRFKTPVTKKQNSNKILQKLLPTPLPTFS